MEKWITCKECGHEFSASMSRCPECGKWRLTTKTAIGSLLGVAFLAVVIFGIVAGFSGNSDQNIKTTSGENSSITSSDSSESNESFASSLQTNQETNSAESIISDTEVTDNSSKQNKPLTESSSSDNSSENDTSAISYPVGTTIKNNLVYTTVPKFYLDYLYTSFGIDAEMSFDKFAYSLKAEDKEYGYTECIRNTNGNATLVLPWSKLNDMTVKRLTKAVKYIHDTENQKFIKKIGYTEKMDKFEIILNTDKLTDEQQASFVMFGLYFLEYQYSTRDGSNKCEVVVIYPDSSKKTLVFPDIIK